MPHFSDSPLVRALCINKFYRIQQISGDSLPRALQVLWRCIERLLRGFFNQLICTNPTRVPMAPVLSRSPRKKMRFAQLLTSGKF
jgi:hypothetical protein